MRLSSLAVTVILIVAPTRLAPALDAAPEFAVANIGAEIAPSAISIAAAVSENGDAVGEIWFSGYRQAFVYTYEHGPMLLPFVDGLPNARAFDISDRDGNGEVIVVGAAGDGFYDETGLAVYWTYSTVSGQVVDSGEIGILPGYSQSVVRAITNDGRAVGSSRVPGTQPMVYDFGTGELVAFDFPADPADANNLGQVVGGTYVGDLDGNFVNLGVPTDTTGASLSAISDTGWKVGTAGMPYTDGAGHFVNGVVRHLDTWQLLYANSWLDSGNDINSNGDVVGAIGVSGAVRPSLYVAGLGLYLIEDLITPSQPFTPGIARSINNAGQIAVGYQAAVLTPLGETIIPGDVNGNAVVDLDDLCAWLDQPVDLDGDGDIDDDDEQWMLDRLETLGFAVEDCNVNGVPDHCEILDGTSADCNENGILDACEPDCDGNGVPDDCESDCNDNGIPDGCDIADGTSTDCNDDGIPDECGGSDVIEYVNPFDPPVLLLPDSTYTDELLVTGAGDIADLDFTLDIDYRIGNLVVRLTHGAVTITLIDQPGVPETPLGNGQLGYRITLDDDGTGGPIEDEGNFGSPFEPIESPPSYTPDEPLATFDGMPLNGVWTVEVTTVGFSPVSGFISWGLVITDEAVDAECPASDLDGDGDVDGADLGLLLGAWGACDGCPADLDGNRVVDGADLGLLLGEWGS